VCSSSQIVLVVETKLSIFKEEKVLCGVKKLVYPKVGNNTNYKVRFSDKNSGMNKK
jgi:hypothetical protein